MSLENSRLNLREVIDLLIHERLKAVYTAIPAHVLSFNASEQMAQIELGVKRVDVNGQSVALETMVETSSNIAVVKTEENEIEVLASQRSNVMSNLDNECNTIQAVFQLAGAEVEQNDGYPAWKMKADSKLTKLAVDSYVKLFGKEPIVRGIHAGLECGLFSERYPNMDMVSFGQIGRAHV